MHARIAIHTGIHGAPPDQMYECRFTESRRLEESSSLSVQRPSREWEDREERAEEGKEDSLTSVHFVDKASVELADG